MYQALYRKYRPQTFDEIVGQDVIIRILKNSIKNNKLTHAYLFNGPRGTGKTSIAKIFAKTVNCLNLNELIPCNNCVSCTQINNKQSTDIIEIDAASNNGIDEIRELKSKVNLVPSNSKYKVYIIDEVHMLTTGAFNALLKTLEEPPSHIIFILATTEPHKIPLTILSRCQKFDFKKIDVKEIVERLKEIVKKENIQIAEEALFEIAELSDGGMRDAISILDQVISYSNAKITIEDVHEVNGTISQKEMINIITLIIKNDITSIFYKIDEYNKNGKNLIKLTERMLICLRNILLYLNAPKYLENNNIDITDFENLVNTTKINEIEILNMIKLINEFLFEMKNSNNSKIMLEMLIIKLTHNKQNDTKIIQEIVHPNSSISQEIKIKTKCSTNDYKNNQLLKETKKIESKIDVDKKKKIDELKKIRINNALATFQKTTLIEIKKRLENIHCKLLIPEYSTYVSMIIDGELKVGSESNLLFVFNSGHMSDIFNENIPIIEKIIFETLNQQYKVIATDIDDWSIIKNEYNNRIKEYNLIEEHIDEFENIFKSEESITDDIKNLFGNIVEYEEENI